MNQLKHLAKIEPKLEVFMISPYNNSIQTAITTELCNLTGLTVEEMGYIGSSAWLDRKDKKKLILSKFSLSKATAVVASKFGGSTKFQVKPEFEKLHGNFYYGDIEDYFYDVDEKSDSLIIRWHPHLILAYLTDTYLLDPAFRIDYKIIQKEDKKSKDKDRDSHIPAVFIVERTHQKALEAGAENHYDAAVAKEYLDILLGYTDDDNE